jgi:hypothetical protein
MLDHMPHIESIKKRHQINKFKDIIWIKIIKIFIVIRL